MTTNSTTAELISLVNQNQKCDVCRTHFSPQGVKPLAQET